MKISAAYIRVSTTQQDEYSLDSQLKLIREYGKKNGYIIPDEYVFVDDGISGRAAKNRGAFQQMIGYAKEKDKPFECILLWKFSRFARNQEEAIFYKSMLARQGISVISISEPLPEGPFGSLMERILEWMDEFYSIRLSGEVKRGMLEKFSRGEPLTPPPFGYKMHDKQYYPDENADIVRSVFQSYLNGDGLRTIAIQLRESGIRTKRGCLPDNRFVEYMLHNPVYIGKIRWSKDGRAASSRHYDDDNIIITDGQHEPIIDIDTWNAVQKRLAENKKLYGKYQRGNQPAEWSLKGLMRCSSCGATLVLQSLACPSIQCHNYARGSCATSHGISLAKADAAVITALEQAAAEQNFRIVPNTPAKKATMNIDKLISAEEKKLARVYEAYEAGIDSLQEYADKKRQINETIQNLENMKACEETPQFDPAAFAKKVQKVTEYIKRVDVTPNEKNKALRSILTKIVYEKEAQNLALYFYV